MPVRRTYRRRRAPMRRTRFKKRVRSRRSTMAAKKRRRASRATFRTNGFPRTKIVTLKYCDNITDLTPKSDGAFSDQHAPGIARFSANCSGRPDIPTTDFPVLARAFRGQRPHQPLGFDQYSVIYRSCRVLRSSITVDLTWSRKAGFASTVPGPDGKEGSTTNSQYFHDYGGGKTPVGFYAGIMRMWSRDPILLPQVYSEYLERFRSGLKFVKFTGTESPTAHVRLTSQYYQPKKAAADAMLRDLDGSLEGATHVYGSSYSRDPYVFQTGDMDSDALGSTVPAVRNRLTVPSGEMMYYIVVYYPDASGQYRLYNDEALVGVPVGYFDGFSLRGTVRPRS